MYGDVAYMQDRTNIIEIARLALIELTDEERLDLMLSYCRGCGCSCDSIYCQCQNDD